MKFSLTIATGILVAGLSNVAAVAQDRAPRLVLYSQDNFAGRTIQTTSDLEQLSSMNFNDAARSMIAEGRWEICQHIRYEGTCRTFEGRVAHIPRDIGGISSVRYVGPGQGYSGGYDAPRHDRADPRQPSGQSPRLVLYSEDNFAGRSIQTTSDLDRLSPMNFNDAARSMIAEGRWEICQHIRYEGTCRTFEGRVANIPRDIGGISSVRYVGPGRGYSGGGHAANPYDRVDPRQPSGQAPRLVLYSLDNFTGRSIQTTSDLEQLSSMNFNDAARSMIAEGRWEICQHIRYEGTCRTFEGRVAHIPRDIGGISSVRYVGPGRGGATSRVPAEVERDVNRRVRNLLNRLVD